MSNHDKLQRFLFDEFDIRGQIVQLDTSFSDALANHEYPKPIQLLLGEFMTLAATLASNLKFDGIVTLQARGNGPISTIMAECSDKNQLRCIAQYDESLADDAFNHSFTELMSGGVIALTVDPKEGQRYQGIVPLEGDTLAECLGSYFMQSEQLATQFWTYQTDSKVAAIMLQVLPGENVISKAGNDEAWERIIAFIDTVSKEEACELAIPDLLHRLFHEDKVRVYEATDMRFECSCSIERVAKALISVERAELEEVIDEQGGELAVDCQFCRKSYSFDKDSLGWVFTTPDENIH